MVMRKPVPPNAKMNLGADSPDLPYPVTPSSTDASPAFKEQIQRRERLTPADDESNSQNAWTSDNIDGESLPSSLRAGNGKRSMEGSPRRSEELPESLRAGRLGFTPRSSAEIERPPTEPTNPYLRRQQTGSSGLHDGRESSASAWGGPEERPAPPSIAPPPPPVHKDTPPNEKFPKLSVAESNKNPWQRSIEAKPLPPHPAPTITRQDSGNEAWSSAPAQPSKQRLDAVKPPVLITIPSNESPAWDENEQPSRANLTPSSDLPEVVQPDSEEQNAWAEHEIQRRQDQAALEAERAAQEEYLRREGGWELDLAPQETGIVENPPTLPIRNVNEEHPPALPPRRSHEEAPTRLSQPLSENEESTVTATSAVATVRRQKKETYEIKKVSWYDANAASNPRISPILVQNANGPCPLLALVNALTISTPADMNTALVETLRSREQVSLGLLLDAVFDELMSGRRGDAAQELPDVGDLYTFLVTLHTGMNVNPRFFPPAPTNLLDDPRRSMSHLHPTEREETIPGTFEDTREMKLYSTFSIPLIHGWLPAKDSPAYAALQRSAKTYEDAQNLMFREEELEDKLEREGLSFEEQSTLEDISTIKAFFTESATQLTSYGLETITKSVVPGSVAILFRNDHFSTLYKHPDSHQLLHLVTDMGYAGHEEVVWESLVDVNGENCEFFSGDFRIVGDAPGEQRPSVDNSEWTTVSRQGNQSQSAQSINPLSALADNISTSIPLSPNTEQEDHDLALALQLQDEEEQRHEAELARRRQEREAELSQQYIEQQGSQNASSAVPVSNRGSGRNNNNNNNNRGQGRGRNGSRGGSRGGSADLRPAIPPRRSNTQPISVPAAPADPEAGVDVPPPSYEQAATQPSYIPPVNHPAHPSASTDRLERRTSAYSTNAAAFGGAQQAPRPVQRGVRVNSLGARAGALINEVQNNRRPVQQQQGQEREKDCVVM